MYIYDNTQQCMKYSKLYIKKKKKNCLLSKFYVLAIIYNTNK